nr:hypothetical protein [Leptospira fainei]
MLIVLSLFLNAVLLCILIFTGKLLLDSTKLEDSVAYGYDGSEESLSYLILKRPKNVFGGYKYYFGAKIGRNEPPFVQKYSPILDSDRDKFDQIASLDPCGQDTYVLTLKTNETLRYLKFNVFDKEPKPTDEKGLVACKRH